jgi:hypothetical protein
VLVGTTKRTNFIEFEIVERYLSNLVRVYEIDDLNEMLSGVEDDGR